MYPFLYIIDRLCVQYVSLSFFFPSPECEYRFSLGLHLLKVNCVTCCFFENKKKKQFCKKKGKKDVFLIPHYNVNSCWTAPCCLQMVLACSDCVEVFTLHLWEKLTLSYKVRTNRQTAPKKIGQKVESITCSTIWEVVHDEQHVFCRKQIWTAGRTSSLLSFVFFTFILLLGFTCWM